MILIITWTTFRSGNISSRSCFHSSHPFPIIFSLSTLSYPLFYFYVPIKPVHLILCHPPHACIPYPSNPLFHAHSSFHSPCLSSCTPHSSLTPHVSYHMLTPILFFLLPFSLYTAAQRSTQSLHEGPSITHSRVQNHAKPGHHS